MTSRLPSNPQGGLHRTRTPHPQPSHLHSDHARPRVAGLVDSLVVFGVSAVVGCRQSNNPPLARLSTHGNGRAPLARKCDFLCLRTNNTQYDPRPHGRSAELTPSRRFLAAFS
jgi:hypothetical protein